MKKFTPVFIVSFVLTIAFILWGAVAPKNLEAMSSSAQGFLQTNFGWFYLFAASAILIFVIFLAFSRFGDIRLGKDDEEPEYSRFSWFAMLFSALWFSVFGGTGIYFEHFQNAGIWELMKHGEYTEIALFATLGELPLATIAVILSIVLISTFFITSADSATFVIGMQTTNGMLNPPMKIKLTWGMIQAGAATVLLWSGGLNALQTASIVSAFPFVFILLSMIFSLLKALNDEPLMKGGKVKR